MIKTSPMLDIKKAISDLGGVSAVHVVADKNEVKELILIVNSSDDLSQEPLIHSVNFQGETPVSFSFDYKEEAAVGVELSTIEEYLYEPNASILKAGAFKSVAIEFGLRKLHANTHLYTSTEVNLNFPGRVFRVLEKASLNKKQLRKVLPEMKANVTVRNYPMTVAQIRKKTGLKEGGDHYLIGFTDMSKAQVVLASRVH